MSKINENINICNSMITDPASGDYVLQFKAAQYGTWNTEVFVWRSLHLAATRPHLKNSKTPVTFVSTAEPDINGRSLEIMQTP